MSTESEVLVKLGKEALNSGDFAKAVELLQKANNLHPTPNTSKLLEKAKNSLQSTSIPSYTPDDEQVTKSILQKTNFYDILEVDQSATQEQIKKAYQKLARKVHPDKNQAPNATKAFTRLQKAYECLTDESRRAHYDELGEDDEQGLNPDFSFSKEGILVIIGGVVFGSFLSPSHFVHRWFKEGEPKSSASKSGYKFLSIVFLLSLMALSWGLQEEKIFSLQPSPYFNTVFQSQKLGFNFYLNGDAASVLPGGIEVVQKEAENYYLANLQRQCQKSKGVRNSILAKMKNTDTMNSKLYQHYANSIDQSACQRLDEIYKLTKPKST